MKKSFLFLLLSCSFLNAATPIKNISEIATGDYFILLLKQNKNVLALGDNKYGELGNGESGVGLEEENPVTVVSPSKIGVLTNIKAIAGGSYHSSALDYAGNVYSWGSNSDGQLGDNTYNGSKFPVQVVSLTNIKAIACGAYYSLALHDSGNVYSWGGNFFGQLGNGGGGPGEKSKVPVQVVGEGSSGFIKAIAAGWYHSLALYDNGDSDVKLYSWGDNRYGQLGNGGGGPGEKSTIPVQVVDLTNIKSMAGGEGHSLALDDNGRVYSWGWNSFGQLGIGSEIQESSTPILIESLDNIIAVSADTRYSLALRNDGTVWFWGSLINSSGSALIKESKVPIQLTEEMMQYIPKEFFSPKVFY